MVDQIEKMLSGRDLKLYKIFGSICINKNLLENLDEKEKEAYEYAAQYLADKIDKEIIEDIKKCVEVKDYEI